MLLYFNAKKSKEVVYRTVNRDNRLRVCKSIKKYLDKRYYSRVCAVIHNAVEKELKFLNLSDWLERK